MEKKQASDILESALGLSRPLDQMLADLHALPPGQEKEEMMKALGDIFKVLTMQIVFPIVKQYPELDPDK